MIMRGNSQQALGHCSYSGKQWDDLILQAINRGTPPPDSRQPEAVAFADNSGSEQSGPLEKPEIESVSLLLNVMVAQDAVRAGYSEKTAHSIGQRLLKNVEIQNAISEAKAASYLLVNVKVQSTSFPVKLAIRGIGVFKLKVLWLWTEHLPIFLRVRIKIFG